MRYFSFEQRRRRRKDPLPCNVNKKWKILQGKTLQKKDEEGGRIVIRNETNSVNKTALFTLQYYAQRVCDEKHKYVGSICNII